MKEERSISDVRLILRSRERGGGEERDEPLENGGIDVRV